MTTASDPEIRGGTEMHQVKVREERLSRAGQGGREIPISAFLPESLQDQGVRAALKPDPDVELRVGDRQENMLKTAQEMADRDPPAPSARLDGGRPQPPSVARRSQRGQKGQRELVDIPDIPDDREDQGVGEIPSLDELPEVTFEEHVQRQKQKQWQAFRNNDMELTIDYLIEQVVRLKLVNQHLTERLGHKESYLSPELEDEMISVPSETDDEWASLIQIIMGVKQDGRRLHLVTVDGTKLSATGFTAHVDQEKGNFEFRVKLEKDVLAAPDPTKK